MPKAGALLAVILFLGAVRSACAAAGISVEIDLEQQTAYLIQGRRIVLESPISTGRPGHLTEGGSFHVIEKERNHSSSIYGRIVDADGRTLVSDADVDMKVPRGGRFIPAPMRYFMRFHGADGMHAGYLPGYPASHGCVRMPVVVCPEKVTIRARMRFFVDEPGLKGGPYSETEVLRMIESGKIHHTTPCRPSQEERWSTVAEQLLAPENGDAS